MAALTPMATDPAMTQRAARLRARMLILPDELHLGLEPDTGSSPNEIDYSLDQRSNVRGHGSLVGDDEVCMLRRDHRATYPQALSACVLDELRCGRP
jgi:hypothetical protein